jgi:hypothetical protein
LKHAEWVPSLDRCWPIDQSWKSTAFDLFASCCFADSCGQQSAKKEFVGVAPHLLVIGKTEWAEK